jgi:hypothetical protein
MRFNTKRLGKAWNFMTSILLPRTTLHVSIYPLMSTIQENWAHNTRTDGGYVRKTTCRKSICNLSTNLVFVLLVVLRIPLKRGNRILVIKFQALPECQMVFIKIDLYTYHTFVYITTERQCKASYYVNHNVHYWIITHIYSTKITSSTSL